MFYLNFFTTFAFYYFILLNFYFDVQLKFYNQAGVKQINIPTRTAVPTFFPKYNNANLLCSYFIFYTSIFFDLLFWYFRKGSGFCITFFIGNL